MDFNAYIAERMIKEMLRKKMSEAEVARMLAAANVRPRVSVRKLCGSFLIRLGYRVLGQPLPGLPRAMSDSRAC
jgi:hypothetical protein